MESIGNELNKLITISSNVFKLYRKLSYAEVKYGRDSEEYKKISSYIEMSVEAENEYYDSLLKNKKTLSLFRKLWDESYHRNVLNPFQNSFCTLESNNDSKKFNKNIASRALSELDVRSDNKFLSSEYNLVILKNYVLLLDKYISECNDKKLKSKLINEKNAIIFSNKSLECWYLGFEKINMKCSIVDNNIIQAYILGLGLEDYISFKEDYLSYFCRSIINHFLLCKIDDFDRIKSEIRLLAVLLDMDCVTLEMNYRYSQELTNQKGFQNGDFDFIDGVFAKSSELVKKKKNFNI